MGPIATTSSCDNLEITFTMLCGASFVMVICMNRYDENVSAEFESRVATAAPSSGLSGHDEVIRIVRAIVRSFTAAAFGQDSTQISVKLSLKDSFATSSSRVNLDEASRSGQRRDDSQLNIDQ
jgi:hypothetical protein